MTIDTDYDTAWNRSLAERGGWQNPNRDDTYECPGTERVFVKRTVIKIRTIN